MKPEIVTDQPLPQPPMPKLMPVSMFSLHFFPNAVTMLALCSGMTALFYATSGLISSAIACVLLAAILDACDGRVARATGTSSKFGAELDSLADVICFGAVPAFILYQWGMSELATLGWFACLLLPVAAAYRLARFNVMADVPKPTWMSSYFTGIPAPAGAFLSLLPIFADYSTLLDHNQVIALAFFTLPLVAVLMMSTWPTFSGKSMGRRALGIMFVPSFLLLVAAAIGMFFYPWTTLTLSAVLYLATLPLSKWRHTLLSRRTGL
jgi:CDP-diacylglycerol---serine O-phosphatidyltransferase